FGAPSTYGDVVAQAASGGLDALYAVGGDPAGWLEPPHAEALAKAELTVVQDILPSLLSEQADYVLSAGSFAERDGSFVNYKGLAQEIHRSIRTPDGARPDGRILWDLSGRRGLFNAAAVRKEMAQEIQAFKAFDNGVLGEFGVLLNVHGAPEPHVVAAGTRT
ncbi:MAG TPA: molybdopterin-dependent oxidoreductase, partial [Bradyrhizobium sp.]|nr:molybdopterin-dependent oxidoreductase [Bradyrhizobium sp.]